MKTSGVEFRRLMDVVTKELEKVAYGEVTITIGIKDRLIRTSKIATSQTILHPPYGPGENHHSA